MTLKITPGAIVSDGHVVLMPPGVTGEVTTSDGTTYDLGPADQIAIEVDTHEHAKEVVFEVCQIAAADESIPTDHDEATSRKNLGLKKGK